MKLTGPGRGGDIQHAAGVAEFGAVFALLNLEFLEGVDGGLDQSSALMMIGDVCAIEEEGELAAFHSADSGAGFVIGANSQQVAGAGKQCGAGGESCQLIKAAAVQREVYDLGV